jgi:hypothetical protein
MRTRAPAAGPLRAGRQRLLAAAPCRIASARRPARAATMSSSRAAATAGGSARQSDARSATRVTRSGAAAGPRARRCRPSNGPRARSAAARRPAPTAPCPRSRILGHMGHMHGASRRQRHDLRREDPRVRRQPRHEHHRLRAPFHLPAPLPFCGEASTGRRGLRSAATGGGIFAGPVARRPGRGASLPPRAPRSICGQKKPSGGRRPPRRLRSISARQAGEEKRWSAPFTSVRRMSGPVAWSRRRSATGRVHVGVGGALQQADGKGRCSGASRTRLRRPSSNRRRVKT